MDIRLTPTSFIVLGLVERAGEATPYALKQRVAGSVGNFWSLQHAQLYTEPERLAEAGLLTERRETGGRRRRTYAITAAGRRALRAWLDDPADEPTELRDPALLQLFFGADPAVLAPVQRDAHQAKLDEYEALDQAALAEGPRLALQAGIAHAREWVRFWGAVAR